METSAGRISASRPAEPLSQLVLVRPGEGFGSTVPVLLEEQYEKDSVTQTRCCL